jgi:biopolymer transport protein ExbD
MGGIGTMDEESDNPVEINATAMVDVTLCLCAFFMCTFQWKQLEGKVETWLPKDTPHYHAGCGAVIEELRVFMKWDPESNTIARKVGNRGAVSSDSELMDTLEVCRKDFKKAGRPRVPVLIDATESVPWQEIVHLVDLCRNAKFPVEFAAPIR